MFFMSNGLGRRISRHYLSGESRAVRHGCWKSVAIKQHTNASHSEANLAMSLGFGQNAL